MPGETLPTFDVTTLANPVRARDSIVVFETYKLTDTNLLQISSQVDAVLIDSIQIFSLPPSPIQFLFNEKDLGIVKCIRRFLLFCFFSPKTLNLYRKSSDKTIWGKPTIIHPYEVSNFDKINLYLQDPLFFFFSLLYRYMEYHSFALFFIFDFSNFFFYL